MSKRTVCSSANPFGLHPFSPSTSSYTSPTHTGDKMRNMTLALISRVRVTALGRWAGQTRLFWARIGSEVVEAERAAREWTEDKGRELERAEEEADLLN